MISAESLGSPDFKRAHGVRYAYVSGSMVRGIASVPLVVDMARAGFLGYFGTGGLAFDAVDTAISELSGALGESLPWGMNILSSAGTPQAEMDIVDLYLRRGVRRVEASAYMQISPALVKYRAKGLSAGAGGTVHAANLIMGKISRPEVATQFLSPAPTDILRDLLADGQIDEAEAELAARVPMADDICVEADSGGHTDMGSLPVLLPTMLRLRDEIGREHGYPKAVRIGAAGGIGTPESAAAAFMLGADFILTGSINQCTVEAGTSDAAKDLLQQINVQDTDYCPSGTLFELGAKTQVLKKGVFFPARANRLYDLWRAHDSLDRIDPAVLTQIEEKYFRHSIEDVWNETRAYYLKAAPGEVERAEASPKHKMALIFRWYFVHTMRLASAGDPARKTDYQIHCGPALGAFNQWVRGTELEDWRNRHPADIGQRLLTAAADVLAHGLARLSPQTASAAEISAAAEARA